jgi:nitroreductase
MQRRAMVRSFSREPVALDVVDRLVEGALRAPTAGHTRGTAWVALQGADQTAAYWAATTDARWRAEHWEWAEGLMRAPVVLLSYASPDAYVARYAAPDKAASGLGVSEEHWPIPYWYCDAAFAVMAVLLGATDAGLGACLLGAFRGEEAVAAALGVPAGWRLFGAVALGHPDGESHRSSSLDRTGPKPADRIHRGRWRS